MKPRERQFTLEQAEGFLRKSASELGLSFSLRSHGESPTTWMCELVDHSGKWIAAGMGKGSTSETARVGSMFEAFEHHVSSCLCPAFPLSEVTSLSRLEAGERLFRQLLPNKLFKDSGLLNARTHWIEFQRQTDPSEKRMHPVFMIDPDYQEASPKGNEIDFDAWELGTTNSGTAIGCSHEEAMLHGLLECVEREACWGNLFKHYCLDRKDSLKIVDIRSIPENYFKLIEKIQNDFKVKVVLIDSSDELGIPAYMAVALHSPWKLNPNGAGCSLDPTYALERAILELFQVMHAYSDPKLNSSNQEEDETCVQSLSGRPKLLDLARIETNRLEAHAKSEPPRKWRSAPSAPRDVSEMLAEVAGRIESQGFSIWKAPVYVSSDQRIHCVRILIPDFSDVVGIAQGQLPVLRRRLLSPLDAA